MEDPLTLFTQWFGDAVAEDLSEPNAMALATASGYGIPSIRMVILRHIDSHGAVFCTNYGSQKAAELEAKPWASAVMLWNAMHRQVRIEGPVERTNATESDEYFAAHSRSTQLSLVALPQSEVITGRADLERRVRETTHYWCGYTIPRPNYWGGYRIGLRILEFWEEDPGGLHNRIRYRYEGNQWVCERLSP